jgi:hypothetical protein
VNRRAVWALHARGHPFRKERRNRQRKPEAEEDQRMYEYPFLARTISVPESATDNDALLMSGL